MVATNNDHYHSPTTYHCWLWSKVLMDAHRSWFILLMIATVIIEVTPRTITIIIAVGRPIWYHGRATLPLEDDPTFQWGLPLPWKRAYQVPLLITCKITILYPLVRNHFGLTSVSTTFTQQHSDWIPSTITIHCPHCYSRLAWPKVNGILVVRLENHEAKKHEKNQRQPSANGGQW